MPPPQAPVCDQGATALVLWAPRWRPDQKDVEAREDAAAAGLNRFLAESGCFAHAELRRASPLDAGIQKQAKTGRPFDQIVTVEVRELGPVVRLLSSAALIEGGTEVVLQISTRPLRQPGPTREFTIHWRHGGPGVIRGVASLPDDMSAALRSGLQPGPLRR